MHTRHSAVFCALAAALPVTLLAAPGTGPSIAGAALEPREMSFESRGTALHGTLYVPRGVEKCAAVIVLHGASSPSRTLPLYRHLQEMLPPLGIAVFVFDRRSGGAGQYNFDLLSEDGIAARQALAKTSPLDAARIGYWGVSQGGWLAVLAGTKDPQAAFVISVSAPMTPPDIQMNFAVENILRIKGYSGADIDEALGARRAIDDYLRGSLERSQAQRALNAARQRPWFSLIYLDAKLPERAGSARLQQMRFDPRPLLAHVKAPTLLIYGGADPWVPVRDSLQYLAVTSEQHRNVKAVVVDGADHTMMLSVSPADQIDPEFFPREAPNAPAYFALLASWLTEHGFARAVQR